MAAGLWAWNYCKAMSGTALLDTSDTLGDEGRAVLWASRGMQWEMDIIVTSNEAHCNCRTRVAECVYHAAAWFNLMYLIWIPAGFDMSSKG